MDSRTLGDVFGPEPDIVEAYKKTYSRTLGDVFGPERRTCATFRGVYSRTLGDVFGPERHDEDSELPSGSGAQGGVANPNPCKF